MKHLKLIAFIALIFLPLTLIASEAVRQERIYLQLDNSSYYRGDRLFFSCYLVEAAEMKPSELSKTVYVELLNPAGKVIDHCVLRPVDGRCHGSFAIEEVPFYSGFYEIRAYTKYMLNFGEDAIYSRVFPVFHSPLHEGKWRDRRMMVYGSRKHPFSRPRPELPEGDLSVRFHPEGGHLIEKLPGRIAFECLDRHKRPLKALCQIIDSTTDSIIASAESGRSGRGVIDFAPQHNNYRAEIEYDGQTYNFALPEVESEGMVLLVDNVSVEDSVIVNIIRCQDAANDSFNVDISCRGSILHSLKADMGDSDTLSFAIPRNNLPEGVNQLTLSDQFGTVLCARSFFNNRADAIDIEYEFDKERYNPFEPIELTVRLKDRTSGMPLQLPFSISVTDADNSVSYGSNMYADLLLTSEIEGYVHNSAYFFENPRDIVRRKELDWLLMLQDYHRFSHPEIKTLPEQDIELHGTVVAGRKNTPQPGAMVSTLIMPLDKNAMFYIDDRAFAFQETDSLGRFTFHTNIDGDFTMSLRTNNKKGKSSLSHRILLDKRNRPLAKRFDVGELWYELDTIRDLDISPVEKNDSTIILNEVEVKAKPKRSLEWAVQQHIENAVVNHDVEMARDNLADAGYRNVRYLSDLLPLIDPNFQYMGQGIRYKGLEPIYVVDPNVGANKESLDTLETPSARDIPIDIIKSVYINDKKLVVEKYADMLLEQYRDFNSRFGAIGKYGCVVFIEFYPQMRRKASQGTRRITLEGYQTKPIEFHSLDYDKEDTSRPDYRRTLYWNPDASTDSTGTATFRFYNNGKVTRPRASIAVIRSGR